MSSHAKPSVPARTRPLQAMVLDARGTVLFATPESEGPGGHGCGPLQDKSFFVELARIPGVAEAEPAFHEGLARGEFSLSFVVWQPAERSAPPRKLRIHLRSLPRGQDARAVALIEEVPGDERVDDPPLPGLDRIVHDISNPLMGLMGHAELLRQQPELSEASRHKLDTILDQARRIRERLDELSRLLR